LIPSRPPARPAVRASKAGRLALRRFGAAQFPKTLAAVSSSGRHFLHLAIATAGKFVNFPPFRKKLPFSFF
jgi:hypothetical protein